MHETVARDHVGRCQSRIIDLNAICTGNSHFGPSHSRDRQMLTSGCQFD